MPSFSTFTPLDDEDVILDMLLSRAWTSIMYPLTLGLWELWRRRHHVILTNQRVVVRKGIIAKSQQAVPIDRIQDAGLTTSIFGGGSVRLSSAGGSLGVEVIKPLTRPDATQFSIELSKLLAVSRRAV